MEKISLGDRFQLKFVFLKCLSENIPRIPDKISVFVSASRRGATFTSLTKCHWEKIDNQQGHVGLKELQYCIAKFLEIINFSMLYQDTEQII